ncbi:hypothetical protein BH18THE1_BH18THE1_18240 [soil metagenome]
MDVHFTEQAKKLREKGAEIVGEDTKSAESMPSRIEHEPDPVKQDKVNPSTTEKSKASINMIARKPIMTALIIVAIVLGGFLVYTLVQYGNQSYKIENFNALWNASLGDLRSGNVSVTEYCNQGVHDQNFCDQFWNLKYMD